MDILEEVIQKYSRLVSRRHRARQTARDEFKEVIKARTEELVKSENHELLSAIREAHEQGYSASEIQKNCFYGKPLVWAELRREADLPEGRRGRKAKEMTHGKNGTYNRGCRCEPCSEAAKSYQREYNRKKKEGDK